MAMSPRLLRPRASATGFDPRKITGLWAWWDASDTATLGPTDAGPGTVSVNGPVKYLGDKSGLGRHMTTAGADSTAPVRVVSSRTGKSGLAFDGGDVLSRASQTLAQPFTVFFVLDNIPDTALGKGLLESSSNNVIRVSNSEQFQAYFGAAGVLNSSTGQVRGVYSMRINSGSASNVWVNTTQGTSVTLGTSPLANNATLRFGNEASANSGFIGDIYEAAVYSVALSDSQVLAMQQYLLAKWGGTLGPPTASNADAQSWINNVYSNGGTVSTATAAAVNTFANDIESAGLRDRFYRLNLFAGSNLSAALVPLYRGPSLGGTQFGNATDTNNNFVSGDYVETGATGGLLGNGSTKSLSTAISTNDLDTATTGHMSAFMMTRTEVNAQFRVALGMFREGAEPTGQEYALSVNGAGGVSRHTYYWSNFANYDFASINTPGNLYTLSRTSGTLATYYGGSTQLATNTGSVTPPQTSKTFSVFRANFATPFFFNSRLGGYSVGRSMTGEQVAAYSAAMQAFQTALTRNV